MIKNLVNLLLNSKTKMNIWGLDLNGDKPFQYTEIRKVIAAIYEKNIYCWFGGVEARTFDQNQKEMESLLAE